MKFTNHHNDRMHQIFQHCWLHSVLQPCNIAEYRSLDWYLCKYLGICLVIMLQKITYLACTINRREGRQSPKSIPLSWGHHPELHVINSQCTATAHSRRSTSMQVEQILWRLYFSFRSTVVLNWTKASLFLRRKFMRYKFSNKRRTVNDWLATFLNFYARCAIAHLTNAEIRNTSPLKEGRVRAAR